MAYNNKQSTKIYVGNVPENSENADLQALFEKYGEVKECDIVKNYAFVHMDSEEDAKTAIEALNNIEFNGTPISVELSHSKVRQRPGMGAKGQCYRCGRAGHWSKECPRNPAMRMNNGGPPPYGGGGPMGYPNPGGYGERFPRFGMARPFGADRSFGGGDQRGFGDRMRPYPDPYERRPPPMAVPPQSSYVYYRRPAAYSDTYSYTRRSPPPAQMPAASRYDFTQDPTFSSGRIGLPTRRAPVY